MQHHPWVAVCVGCGQHEMRSGEQRAQHVTQRILCVHCFREEVLRKEAGRKREALARRNTERDRALSA